MKLMAQLQRVTETEIHSERQPLPAIKAKFESAI